jgi:hypothetical protein
MRAWGVELVEGPRTTSLRMSRRGTRKPEALRLTVLLVFLAPSLGHPRLVPIRAGRVCTRRTPISVAMDVSGQAPTDWAGREKRKRWGWGWISGSGGGAGRGRGAADGRSGRGSERKRERASGSISIGVVAPPRSFQTTATAATSSIPRTRDHLVAQGGGAGCGDGSGVGGMAAPSV